MVPYFQFDSLSALEKFAVLAAGGIFVVSLLIAVWGPKPRWRILSLMVAAYFSHPILIGVRKKYWIGFPAEAVQLTYLGSLFFIPLFIVLLEQKLRKKSIRYAGNTSLWMFLWLLFMLTVALVDLVSTSAYSATYILTGMLCFFGASYLIVQDSNPEEVIWSIKVFTYFLICSSWVYTLLYIGEHGGGILKGGRLLSLSKGSENLGFYVSFFLLSLMAYSKAQSKKLSYLLFFLGLVTVVASGNRASILLLFFGILIISFSTSKVRGNQRKRGNRMPFVIAAICIMSMMYVFSSFFFSDSEIEILSAIDRINKRGVDIVKSNRFEILWPAYFEAIFEKPFGVKGYPAISSLPLNAYPHNIFLFIAYSGGLIAGLFFLIWALNFLIRIFTGELNFAGRLAAITCLFGHLGKVDVIRTPANFAFFVISMALFDMLLKKTEG
jgi:hypothetical protein